MKVKLVEPAETIATSGLRSALFPDTDLVPFNVGPNGTGLFIPRLHQTPERHNSPVLSARLHTERHLPMRVTTTTTKFGSYCVVEPVNETETG